MIMQYCHEKQQQRECGPAKKDEEKCAFAARLYVCISEIQIFSPL